MRALLAALFALLLGAAACGSAAGPIDQDMSRSVDAADAAADVDAAPLPARHAATVVDLGLGDGGGYGRQRLPDVVLGPPQGGGDRAGSTDVVSLGSGGTLVLGLDVDLVDGPGDDLVVFENAFYAFGDPTQPFVEPAAVGVSLDGVDFVEWPCQPEPPYDGCAGVHPVFANAARNEIDPASPEAGGDRFDLAAIGVARARFVRIRDLGVCCQGANGVTGFDLDAIALIHYEPRSP